MTSLKMSDVNNYILIFDVLEFFSFNIFFFYNILQIYTIIQC